MKELVNECIIFFSQALVFIMLLYGPITLLLALTAGIADGYSCFQCKNEKDPSKCTNKVQCGSSESCFATQKVGKIGKQVVKSFTMGCEQTAICLAAGHVGRRRSNEGMESFIDRNTRDLTLCSKCCGKDLCNKDLCVPDKTNTEIPATSDLYVRLINGRNPYEGTVEVFHNNQWGSVCHYGWTANDAKVVCRMLGYSTDEAAGVRGGVFLPAKSDSRISLEHVKCVGTEKSLSDCSHNSWVTTGCTHAYDAGVVCSAVSSQNDIIFLLDSGAGGAIYRMDLKTLSFAPIPINQIYTPSSFDYDQSQGRLYFVDAKLRQIVSIRFDGTDARNIRQLDPNAILEKLEVDPLNHILFYTDTGNDIIASMKTDGSDYKILINSSLDQPRDIVMDPRTKTMYWTDWGKSPKIEMAKYDGSSRSTLVKTNIKTPNGLAIDYTSNTLYFVDGGVGKIEALSFKGNNRKLIYSEPGAGFYALNVFKDYLYYTDWNHNISVMRVKKDGTEKSIVGPASFHQLSDLRVHEDGAGLPGVTTPSPVHFDPSHVFVRLSGKGDSNQGRVEVYVNGQWGAICDEGWDQKDANVVCGMLGLSNTQATTTKSVQEVSSRELVLLTDVSCKGSEASLMQCGVTADDWGKHTCSHKQVAGVICKEKSNPDSFMILADSNGDLVRMSLLTYSYTVIPVKASTKSMAVTYDKKNHQIYFTEVTSSASVIRSSDLLGKKIAFISRKIDSQIDGLAVDSAKNILFYTDAKKKALVSMAIDGSKVKTVATTTVDKPRALALDRTKGIVYWTDWGTKPKIEMANYDGTNRKTMASTDLKYPNGIAVDTKTSEVFFCDAGTKRIEKIKGNTRTVLYEDQAAHFFGLTLTKQHLYFSDWNRHGIVRLNRDGSGMFPAGPASFTKINGIFAYQSNFS